VRLIWLSFFIFFTQLHATVYPTTYASIGDDLYTSLPAMQKLRITKPLRDMCSNYIKHATRTLQLGLHVDKTKDRAKTKVYLTKLRELQRAQSYILRSTKIEVEKAIENEDSALFFHLISADLPHLLQPNSFKKKVLYFEKKHAKEKELKSTPIEKKAIKKPEPLHKSKPIQAKKNPLVQKEIKTSNILPDTLTNICTKVSPKHIEKLGNPYTKLYPMGELIYARNIWDMHEYQGLLFLGAGNSSNSGPAPNAGRVPIFSFNTKNDTFHNEGKITEEQIDIFRTINDSLYIPGHDAIQKWTFGNFYKRQNNGVWKKFRNIAKALHLYDITGFDSKLFIGIGLNQISAVGISNDQGENWEIMQSGSSYSRVYSFLNVNDSLYATKTFTPLEIRETWERKRQYNYFSISEYGINENFISRSDLNENIMFPSTELEEAESKKIIHTESFEDKAIYLGAYIHNDHQSETFGAYIASSLEYEEEDIQKIQLPEDTLPFDIVVKNENIYILCYSAFKEEISVHHAKTDNVTSFKKIVHFSSTTFARSFEVIDDDFYFGLGCKVGDTSKWDVAELDDSCGDILRIKEEFITAHF